MMHLSEFARIICPYCGERFDLFIDCTVERQEYIEDCTVCCQPITVSVDCSAEVPTVRARRDDEC
jgi:hypothetical protein